MLAIVLAAPPSYAGKLDAVREAAQPSPADTDTDTDTTAYTDAGPAPAAPAEERSDDSAGNDEWEYDTPDPGEWHTDDDSGATFVLGLFLLGAVAAVAFSPIYGPYYATEEIPPGKNTRRGYFLPYPYYSGFSGSMVMKYRPSRCSFCREHAGCGYPHCQRFVLADAELPACPETEPDCDRRAIPETCVGGTCYSRAELEERLPTVPPCDLPDLPRAKPVQVQISSDFGTDVNLVYRYGFGAQLDTTSRLGFESRWTYYVEPLAGAQDDRLLIGDANVTLRNGQHENVQFHFGVGGRFLVDPGADDNLGGPNFTWGFDAYPGEPIVFSGVVDVGSLGRAFYLDSRVSFGAMLGPIELRAGYDVVLIHPVTFHGPFGGVRLYL